MSNALAELNPLDQLSADIGAEETAVVLVDMDNVLADFDAEVLRILTERHPHIPLLEARENFYLRDDYPDHSKLVTDVSDEPGFFERLPLMEGALEGWQRIIDLGYEPRACSSPIVTNPTSESGKRAWLERHFAPVFGQHVVEQAIITKEKHLFEGIALIDDRPQVRGEDEATWRHIVFDHPYNRDSVAPRLFGWFDPMLPLLLKDAAS